MPSHYCRAAYADKHFLEPGTTIGEVYGEYKTKATARERRIVCYPVFKRIFNEGNYSIFIPRKDQCDVCLGTKHGNITPEDLQKHRLLKQMAQEQKRKDKYEAIENHHISCWTMDMQAVMLSPKTDASCMYYKTKLQLHNFTLFCLENKDGFCYAWDECNGDLSSERFAWLQYHHFNKFLEKNTYIKVLIIWSDGCGYQNRNATVANAYFHLAKSLKVTIYHKFLIAGHTQMECDSMHSTKERKLRTPLIYTPRDYIIAMQHARINPRPYNVEMLKYDFWQNGFQDSYVSSIRPGKKLGDATVHDLRVLQYTESGIKYKVDFENDLLPLPQRIKSTEPVQLQKTFDRKLPISERKFNDLQSLKHVIPSDMHLFYDNLPHTT